MINLFVGVTWSRGDSESFFSPGDGGEIDLLDVDVMFREQHVGSFLG